MSYNKNFTENNDLLDAINHMARKLSPDKKKELIHIMETWEMGGDRRISNRKNIRILVDYSVDDKFYTDQLENICSSGAFIKTANPFHEGHPATMILSHPSLDRNLKISGKIVRKEEQGIGIHFFTDHKKRMEELKENIETIQRVRTK